MISFSGAPIFKELDLPFGLVFGLDFFVLMVDFFVVFVAFAIVVQE